MECCVTVGHRARRDPCLTAIRSAIDVGPGCSIRVVRCAGNRTLAARVRSPEGFLRERPAVASRMKLGVGSGTLWENCDSDPRLRVRPEVRTTTYAYCYRNGVLYARTIFICLSMCRAHASADEEVERLRKKRRMRSTFRPSSLTT